MTKYTSVSSRRPEKKIVRPHPVWRGIGCAFVVLIPIVSGALGKMTVDYGLDNGWVIPYQLLGNPSLPDFIYRSNFLAQVFGPFTTWTHFYAYAAVAVLYMVLLGGVLSIVNAFIYQMIGPPRYGPQDAPPPKIKTKQYKR